MLEDAGSVAIGDGRQLTAYVPLSPNTVTWSVNGVTGGNSTFGTVSTTGLYTAPAVVPMQNAVTVQANYVTDVLGPLMVLSIGLGMAFVSTSVTAISGVQPSESGLASALLNVGRQLGGSLGIAIMGTIAATVTKASTDRPNIARHPKRGRASSTRAS